MGIFDVIKKNIFGVSFESKLMKSISAPVFIKDFNKESEEIIQLNKLINYTNDDETKKKLQMELSLQKYVQEGLSKIYFELKNSSVPFYGLHNIKFEYNGGTANIDFLLVTNQFFCIIKSKTLQGNIEIDSHGNFNRWVQKGEKWTKEGIYSPVEQNRKAELLLKSILINLFSIPEMPVYSLTVFTNPKATLNFKETPENIQDKVIKVDLLNTKINELVEKTPSPAYDEATALNIAETLKGLYSSTPVDYRTKFQSAIAVSEVPETKEEMELAHNKSFENLVIF